MAPGASHGPRGGCSSVRIVGRQPNIMPGAEVSTAPPPRRVPAPRVVRPRSGARRHGLARSKGYRDTVVLTSR
jgi:hypothetical protein